MYDYCNTINLCDSQFLKVVNLIFKDKLILSVSFSSIKSSGSFQNNAHYNSCAIIRNGDLNDHH
jgi:hypothetical protein